MLKAGLHARMLGIAAGNRLTISPIRTIHVKRIVNCFGHYRISSKTVVTLRIGEPLQPLVIYCGH